MIFLHNQSDNPAMKRFVSVLFFISAITCLTANAQLYYSAGSDPFTKWKSIRTEHYDIIYPYGVDSLARVYAANMEAVRKDAIVLPQKVDPARARVILHPFSLAGNDSKRSNAPLRLDIYTSPDMSDYMSEPWEYTTAIAKSRHLGHETLLDRGFFHGAHYVFGDNVRVLGSTFFNNFYWMGDENVAVTDLSHAGAGRNAEFLKVYRTAFVEKDLRNYDRWKLGSYRYMTPGPDGLGYILEANFRYQNDDFLFSREWADNVIATPLKSLFNGRNPGPSGTFMAPYFNTYRNSLADIFQKDYDSRRPFTAATSVWQAKNYSEYSNFVYIESQDAIFAVKKSFQEADQLVKINPRSGTEKFVMYFNPDASPLDEHNGILYWSEIVHKGPWELEDFSEIFSFDTRKGTLKRITKDTRYFNPALNDDCTVIAVSENTILGDSYLTILSPDGEKELSIKAPDNGSIKKMAWIGDVLYCLIVTKDGLGIYSMGDEGWKTRLAPQWQNIYDLSAATLRIDGRLANVLTFASDVDGVLNIYAFEPATRAVHRLINSPYGAVEPTEYKDGGLIYSRYGRTGYSLAKTDAADFAMTPVDMSKPYSFPLADKGTELAGNAYPKPDEEFLANYLDEKQYPSSDYSKPANWFNIHSWVPAYVNAGMGRSHMALPAAPGIMAFSQNYLGTVQAMMGYSYGKSPYSSDWLHGGHFRIVFNGTIPRVELSAEINTTEKVIYAHLPDEYGMAWNSIVFADDGKPFYEISARIFQPLTYRMLGLNAKVEPYISFHHNNNRAIDYIGGRSGSADYMMAGIGGEIQTDLAHSAIYPRWGVGLSLDRISPFAFGKSASTFTSQFSTKLSAYLPGIDVTHGVHLTMDWVRQNWKRGSAVLTTNSLIELPRGYNAIDPLQFSSARYWKGGVDYAVPVYLGDTSLGGFMYLKRLQVIPFFDYAVSKRYDGSRQNYLSTGSDLLVDCNFFRLKVDGSFGVRLSFSKSFEPMQVVFPVQFLVKASL